MNAPTPLAAPGPGAWFLDTSHLTTSCSTYSQALFRDNFLRGFGECLHRYGSLLASLDWEWVEGFPYYRLSAVGAPEGATGHPSREVWDELMSSSSEIRERSENAERAFENKIWREDLDRWDTVDKPAAIEQNKRLLAVDPTTLDTSGLIAYLDECTANVGHGVYLHHINNMAAFIPVGDLLAQGTELSGRSATEILALLQGATPDALGTDHLRGRLQEAAKQPDVRALADAEDADAALQAIAALSGDAGDALREFLSFVAYRPVNGEDVGDTCSFELPDVVMNAVRAELGGSSMHSAVDPAQLAELTEAVRADIEPDMRERFDDVLEEARLMYRIREERAMYGDLWTYGVARRALLAAGARLVAAGRLTADTHLVEASWPEVRSIIESEGGPDAEELAERARYRAEVGFDQMPALLGDAPGDHLPSEWLPDASARMENALGAAIGALFGAPSEGLVTGSVEGLGVSGGVAEGIARVVDSSAEFGRVQDGDILVTRATTAACNVLLPLLRGIVTDRGGLLCHAAVVSREYSIPAVVGTGDATSRIPDGARVRVDGTTGLVTLQK